MKKIYGFIFFLSGATGLIYESVWSHYVKLILGHAAYAQTLVLAIFMGGMALGAWWVSRLSPKIRNLLLAYAIVEGLIGFFALMFHPVFEFSSHVLFDRVLTGMSPGSLAALTKWGLAAMLILPQSILLGSTFPLMSGGVARLEQATTTGSTIALLYFANSIGAVVGVLGAGFYLLGAVGLPGTLMSAGTINVALCIAVYFLSKGPQRQENVVEPEWGSNLQGSGWILLVSAVTGAASFCYEIGWIRMLSMVLGSSTHSFELMLAAFILGLALGGLWIKRRIDTLENPLRFLGIVQIAMGIFALLTVFLYNYTFDLMSLAMDGLSRTATGYVLFSLFGHGIALLIMLPATFCAGMTLPLLTLILWRRGAGEQAIGRVYAVNTLGSIIGVLLAVHLFMPVFGLKGLIMAGAAMDGILGIALLSSFVVGVAAWRGFAKTGALVFGFCWTVVFFLAHLDPLRMGGSVFRSGLSRLGQDAQMLSWRDGKTASVSITSYADGEISISTNGKPDGSIYMGNERNKTTPDEITTLMLAVVPLLYKPDAKKVANVGFGSGMTTHILLGSSAVEQVDTIEIEPEMVRGAKLAFEKKIPRAFQDVRSVVHFDDARTFFSSQGQVYDIIVSEPSNPWVSGVASLFSREYYRHVSRYLSDDGLFVQWLQLYETDLPIVASITGALDEVFDDYAIYATDNLDLLLVARPKGKLPKPQAAILRQEAIKAELSAQGLLGFADFQLRHIADKKLWSPFMAGRAPVNSDFFPYVDLNAARYRFLRAEAFSLTALGSHPVPVLEMLGARPMPDGQAGVGSDPHFSGSGQIMGARLLRDYILSGVVAPLDPAAISALATLREPTACVEGGEAQRQAIFRLTGYLTPYLPPDDLRLVWQHVARHFPCLEKNQQTRAWFDLVRSTSDRNPAAMVKSAENIWRMQSQLVTGDSMQYLLLAEMLGRWLSGDRDGFQKFERERLGPILQQNGSPHTLLFGVLHAQSKVR